MTSSSDYEIHIDRHQYASLWDTEEDAEAFHTEDLEDIDRMLEEEIGRPRRKRRPKKRV